MKVAIVNNSHVIMEGVGHVLSCNFEISELRQYKTYESFRLHIHDFVPDVIIIGLSKILPQSNVSTIGVARCEYPNSGIIVLDEKAGSPIVIDYLRAGASGYLPYDAGLGELIDCVRKVFAHKLYVPNELLAQMMNLKATNSVKKSTKVTLTSREKTIAQLLVEGNKAADIGKSLGVKPATIFATKRTIFNKLGIDSMSKLRQASGELGINLRPDFVSEAS